VFQGVTYLIEKCFILTMPKIEGWSRVTDKSRLANPNRPTWENDSEGLLVQVRKNPMSDRPENTYIVDYLDQNHSRSIIGSARLKRDAVDEAVEWMKNNPNGKIT
jgi:hypothetical protein